MHVAVESESFGSCFNWSWVIRWVEVVDHRVSRVDIKTFSAPEENLILINGTHKII